jgi:hypothetical protein
MQHSRSVRAVTALAMLFSASLATLAVTAPAGAAAAPSCTVLTGSEKTPTKSSLAGCTPTANTGGKGSSITKVGTGTSGTSTITWASNHGVTKLTFKYTLVPASKEKCGTSKVKGKTTKNIEATETGSVTSSTGLSGKVIKKGQKTTATVCINAATQAESLLKGTKFVL